MTINERAATVLQEIDAALALAETATPGPWRITNEDGVWISYGSGFDIAEVLPTVGGAQRLDATFIAASRTGWPASLRCLKTAIEGLLNVQGLAYREGVANAVIKRDLTTLCDQWESGR